MNSGHQIPDTVAAYTVVVRTVHGSDSWQTCSRRTKRAVQYMRHEDKCTGHSSRPHCPRIKATGGGSHSPSFANRITTLVKERWRETQSTEDNNHEVPPQGSEPHHEASKMRGEEGVAYRCERPAVLTAPSPKGCGVRRPMLNTSRGSPRLSATTWCFVCSLLSHLSLPPPRLFVMYPPQRSITYA